jgi:hypothetical protein
MAHQFEKTLNQSFINEPVPSSPGELESSATGVSVFQQEEQNLTFSQVPFVNINTDTEELIMETLHNWAEAKQHIATIAPRLTASRHILTKLHLHRAPVSLIEIVAMSSDITPKMQLMRQTIFVHRPEHSLFTIRMEPDIIPNFIVSSYLFYYRKGNVLVKLRDTWYTELFLMLVLTRNFEDYPEVPYRPIMSLTHTYCHLLNDGYEQLNFSDYYVLESITTRNTLVDLLRYYFIDRQYKQVGFYVQRPILKDFRGYHILYIYPIIPSRPFALTRREFEISPSITISCITTHAPYEYAITYSDLEITDFRLPCRNVFFDMLNRACKIVVLDVLGDEEIEFDCISRPQIVFNNLVGENQICQSHVHGIEPNPNHQEKKVYRLFTKKKPDMNFSCLDLYKSIPLREEFKISDYFIREYYKFGGKRRPREAIEILIVHTFINEVICMIEHQWPLLEEAEQLKTYMAYTVHGFKKSFIPSFITRHFRNLLPVMLHTDALRHPFIKVILSIPDTVIALHITSKCKKSYRTYGQEAQCGYTDECDYDCKNFLEHAQTMASSIYKNMATNTSTVDSIANPVIDQVANIAYQKGSDYLDKATENPSGPEYQRIKSFIDRATNLATNMAQDAMVKKVSNIFETVRTWCSDLWTWISETLLGFWGKFCDMLDYMKAQFLLLASFIFSAFERTFTGLSDMISVFLSTYFGSEPVLVSPADQYLEEMEKFKLGDPIPETFTSMERAMLNNLLHGRLERNQNDIDFIKPFYNSQLKHEADNSGMPIEQMQEKIKTFTKQIIWRYPLYSQSVMGFLDIYDRDLMYDPMAHITQQCQFLNLESGESSLFLRFVAASLKCCRKAGDDFDTEFLRVIETSGAVFDVIPKMLKEIAYRITGDLTWRLGPIAIEISSVIEEIQELYNCENRLSKAKSDNPYMTRLRRVQQRVSKIMISIGTEPITNNTTWQAFVQSKQLLEKMTLEVPDKKFVQPRKKPLWWSFVGESQQGKSILTDAFSVIAYNWLQSNGYIEESGALDNLSTFQYDGKEFWNGYIGQAICIMNECLSMNDESVCAITALELLKIVDSAALNLNMADLASKGGVYFISKVLLSNSNRLAKSWEKTGLQSSAALLNRQIYVHIVKGSTHVTDFFDESVDIRDGWTCYVAPPGISTETDKMFNSWVKEMKPFPGAIPVGTGDFKLHRKLDTRQMVNFYIHSLKKSVEGDGLENSIREVKSEKVMTFLRRMGCEDSGTNYAVKGIKGDCYKKEHRYYRAESDIDPKKLTGLVYSDTPFACKNYRSHHNHIAGPLDSCCQIGAEAEPMLVDLVRHQTYIESWLQSPVYKAQLEFEKSATKRSETPRITPMWNGELSSMSEAVSLSDIEGKQKDRAYDQEAQCFVQTDKRMKVHRLKDLMQEAIDKTCNNIKNSVVINSLYDNQFSKFDSEVAVAGTEFRNRISNVYNSWNRSLSRDHTSWPELYKRRRTHSLYMCSDDALKKECTDIIQETSNKYLSAMATAMLHLLLDQRVQIMREVEMTTRINPETKTEELVQVPKPLLSSLINCNFGTHDESDSCLGGISDVTDNILRKWYEKEANEGPQDCLDKFLGMFYKKVYFSTATSNYGELRLFRRVSYVGKISVIGHYVGIFLLTSTIMAGFGILAYAAHSALQKAVSTDTEEESDDEEDIILQRLAMIHGQRQKGQSLNEKNPLQREKRQNKAKKLLKRDLKHLRFGKGQNCQVLLSTANTYGKIATGLLWLIVEARGQTRISNILFLAGNKFVCVDHMFNDDFERAILSTTYLTKIPPGGHVIYTRKDFHITRAKGECEGEPYNCDLVFGYLARDKMPAQFHHKDLTKYLLPYSEIKHQTVFNRLGKQYVDSMTMPMIESTSKGRFSSIEQRARFATVKGGIAVQTHSPSFVIQANDSVSGDCSKPYVSVTNGRVSIVGIHASGGDHQMVAAPICKEYWEQWLLSLPAHEQSCQSLQIPYDSKRMIDFTQISKELPGVESYAKSKAFFAGTGGTNIRMSPLITALDARDLKRPFEITVGPVVRQETVVITEDGPDLVSPFKTNDTKRCTSNTPPIPEDWMYVLETDPGFFYKDLTSDHMSSDRRHLTIEEVIFGSEWCDSMASAPSTGWLGMCFKNLSQRSDLWNKETRWVHPRLVHLVEELLQLSKAGLPFTVSLQCLKDELLPLEDIAKGKVRAFAVGDIVLFIAVTMVFGMALSDIKHNRHGPFVYHYNPHGMDVEILVDAFFKTGNMTAEDASSNDCTSLDYIAWTMCHSLATEYYHYTPGTEQYIQMMNLGMTVVWFWWLRGSTLSFNTRGMGSGHALTSFFNSYLHWIIRKWGFRSLYPTLKFSEHVTYKGHGDDNVSIVNPTLTEYNMIYLCQFCFDTFGVILTDPLKGKITTPYHANQKSIDFLSRTIDVLKVTERPKSELEPHSLSDKMVMVKYYVHKLKISSIHGMMSFYRVGNGLSKEMAIQQNLDSAFTELLYYGEDVYAHYEKLVKSSIRISGLNVEVKPYAYFFERWKNNYYGTDCPWIGSVTLYEDLEC